MLQETMTPLRAIVAGLVAVSLFVMPAQTGAASSLGRRHLAEASSIAPSVNSTADAVAHAAGVSLQQMNTTRAGISPQVGNLGGRRC